MLCLVVCKQWLQQSKEKKCAYYRAFERKATEQYCRKDKDRKQFQRNYRKYVLDPAKYEEFKRQNRETKAAKKANLPLEPKKHSFHLHCLLLIIMQQKLTLKRK